MYETFTNTSLDDFVIKDKDYRLNKLKKKYQDFCNYNFDIGCYWWSNLLYY